MRVDSSVVQNADVCLLIGSWGFESNLATRQGFFRKISIAYIRRHLRFMCIVCKKHYFINVSNFVNKPACWSILHIILKSV